MTTFQAAGGLDVRGIRLGIGGDIGATQETFAHVLGIPVKTLRNWEQQRRQPTGAARVLLMLVARNPRIMLEASGTPRA
jgi:putative transcriptional regulator